MRIVIGVRAKDISTSYRLYDTKQVKSVDLVFFYEWPGYLSDYEIHLHQGQGNTPL